MALRRVLVVALAAGLTGCVSEAAEQRREEAQAIQRAQIRVAALLRDPSSAQFSDIAVRGTRICGMVRGKNAFGGYGSPQKFVVISGSPEIDPSASPVSPHLAQVRVSEQCLFDVEYRTCLGEEGLSNPMERCLTGAAMTSPGQVVTETVAKDACLRALDRRFNEDIRAARLTLVSATATRPNSAAAWVVKVRWSAEGEGGAGLSSTGACVVRSDGRTLVRSLMDD